MSTWAFAPLILVETLSVKLSPPPAPMLNWVVPDEFLRDNPAEFVACTVGVVTLVSVTSVLLVTATLDGNVTNTSFVPAARSSFEPVDEEITVVLANDHAKWLG